MNRWPIPVNLENNCWKCLHCFDGFQQFECPSWWPINSELQFVKLPPLASLPTVRPVQGVSADIQGAPYICCTSPTSANQSHQSAADRDSDLPLVVSSWSAPPLRTCHPCICCGRPKGMEPAAGTFTGTRDSWPLQVGIKDSSLLHPMIVANCLDTPCPCNDFFMLRRVRNRRRCYYYYCDFYVSGRLIPLSSWRRTCWSTRMRLSDAGVSEVQYSSH